MALVITAPDAIIDGVSTQLVGTFDNTIVTVTLETTDESLAIVQSIDSQTATTLDFVPDSGIDDAVAGIPANGIPLTPTITAVGITSYELQVKVDE